ncbi:hypothetical protein HDU97_004744 [Phlyctochytrium planicorne]|nr:hypothetical protein HDU97_004744 [Phlyctochytrium planicorne]
MTPKHHARSPPKPTDTATTRCLSSSPPPPSSKTSSGRSRKRRRLAALEKEIKNLQEHTEKFVVDTGISRLRERSSIKKPRRMEGLVALQEVQEVFESDPEECSGDEEEEEESPLKGREEKDEEDGKLDDTIPIERTDSSFFSQGKSQEKRSFHQQQQQEQERQRRQQHQEARATVQDGSTNGPLAAAVVSCSSPFASLQRSSTNGSFGIPSKPASPARPRVVSRVALADDGVGEFARRSGGTPAGKGKGRRPEEDEDSNVLLSSLEWEDEGNAGIGGVGSSRGKRKERTEERREEGREERRDDGRDGIRGNQRDDGYSLLSAPGLGRTAQRPEERSVADFIGRRWILHAVTHLKSFIPPNCEMYSQSLAMYLRDYIEDDRRARLQAAGESGSQVEGIEIKVVIRNKEGLSGNVMNITIAVDNGGVNTALEVFGRREGRMDGVMMMVSSGEEAVVELTVLWLQEYFQCSCRRVEGLSGVGIERYLGAVLTLYDVALMEGSCDPVWKVPLKLWLEMPRIGPPVTAILELTFQIVPQMVTLICNQFRNVIPVASIIHDQFGLRLSGQLLVKISSGLGTLDARDGTLVFEDVDDDIIHRLLEVLVGVFDDLERAKVKAK